DRAVAPPAHPRGAVGRPGPAETRLALSAAFPYYPGSRNSPPVATGGLASDSRGEGMRHLRLPLAAILLAAAAAPGSAHPPVPFDDAAVHAIQFADRNEGWAVGDDGVIWHTIDGGANWERQKSGTRASLRAVHFFNPYSGWAVGRLDQPGGGSVGVMLRTTDGGLKWEEVGLNVLPGLHLVRFFDDKNGYVGGDGSDAFPSGLFTTTDGGRTWRPVGGPRVPSWRAADCQFADTVIVAGAWSRLGRFGQGSYTDAELDPLSGRTLHAVAVAQSPKSVAAPK